MSKVLERLRGGVIVPRHLVLGRPMGRPEIVAANVLAALNGGDPQRESAGHG